MAGHIWREGIFPKRLANGLGGSAMEMLGKIFIGGDFPSGNERNGGINLFLESCEWHYFPFFHYGSTAFIK